MELEIRFLPFLATGESDPSVILTLMLSAQVVYEENMLWEPIIRSNAPEPIIQGFLSLEVVFKAFKKLPI